MKIRRSSDWSNGRYRIDISSLLPVFLACRCPASFCHGFCKGKEKFTDNSFFRAVSPVLSPQCGVEKAFQRVHCFKVCSLEDKGLVLDERRELAYLKENKLATRH